MAEEPLKLFWKDRLIGQVTDAGWSDFPAATGKVSIIHMPPALREAMEWLHTESNSENGVTDWPFSEDFVWGWRLEKPDGTSEEISQPIIDFGNGDIDWQ
jgi:hypothetical protein